MHAAADPHMFPDQLTGRHALSPWQVKKIFSGGATAGDAVPVAPDCNTGFVPTGLDNVAGVYTADPRLDPDAQFIENITYMDALQRQLKVMDLTALTLCMENDLPIYVFNMDDERNIDRIVCGERVGTVVSTG